MHGQTAKRFSSNLFPVLNVTFFHFQRLVEIIEDICKQAKGKLELTQKISSVGILILKESDKVGVEGKMNELRGYCSTLPGKSREEFNR